MNAAITYPANGNLPAPIGSIADVLGDEGTQASAPVKVFIAHNLGERTFLLSVPMFDFFRMSDVANDRNKFGDTVSQRPLDLKHARELAKYILKGLVSAVIGGRKATARGVPEAYLAVQNALGYQPYLSLQPIVANLRSCKKYGENVAGERLVTKSEETACFKVYLSQQDVLYVVDGQHRRKAMDLVFDFLDQLRSARAYPKRSASLYEAGGGQAATQDELNLWSECYTMARTHCSVQVELHLGLDSDEERQLFYDLNNLGKRVEKNLALKFDSSNPVNNFIKRDLMDLNLVQLTDVEAKTWEEDRGAILHKDLIAVNAHLFLNKTNVSSATPPVVDARRDVAKRFWTSVAAIEGFGEEGARVKTVAAQSVVLKALAKLTFDFAFGRNANEEYLERLLDGISTLDFSHANPMWRYYEMGAEERTSAGLAGLAEYLPSEASGNRDIGKFQNGRMHFGAKHNDIFPIIGDMIRWNLGLPRRREVITDE
jgi:hypothetical protein